MNNQILQCLNQSKILLLHAEQGRWETFEELHPIWTQEVDKCVADHFLAENKSPELAASIQSLIDDVDTIQRLIKKQMQKVEEDFNANRRLSKAVQSYLK